MFLIFFRFIKIVTSFLVIIVSCTVGGESFMCDSCKCENSQINCTDTGVNEILDLWDHSDDLYNATLVHFDNNKIIIVKKLPESKVKYLSLRHNKISKIDDLAFSHLKFLVELDLSYNSLSSENLNSEIFKVSNCLCL